MRSLQESLFVADRNDPDLVFPEQDIEWRVRNTHSMASFMDEADKAYGRLHDGYESTVPPPVENVETNSDSEERDPVSFISMDPTLYEIGTRWPVYSNKDYEPFIFTIGMDPSPQQTKDMYATSDRQANPGTSSDPPGLRRVRCVVDETCPIAPATEIEIETEKQRADWRLEMARFCDQESMTYTHFPNSFISIAETSLATLSKRDPSVSSLSEVVPFHYVEI